MIYIYRILWLIFYIPIFAIELVLFAIGFLILLPMSSLFYYMKDGNIEDMPYYFPFEWVYNVDNWYKDLQK